MNSIILITTEGCKACEIQERIINTAIILSRDKYNIDFKVNVFPKDNTIKYMKESIVKELIITDFPTTIFLVNDDYKTHITGTCTKEHLMHLFDEHFIENVD